MGQTAQFPDPQTAYSTLFDGVHQRVFFHKLAQLRPEYVPQNEKQAAALLDLEAKLRLLDEEDTVKKAAESTDPFTAANQALDQAMQNAGYNGVSNAYQQEEVLSIKQAAAGLMQDDDIYNSVLALKAYEAQQLAQQHAQRQ